MKPFFNNLQELFSTDATSCVSTCPVYDIDDDIRDYNNIIIYELESLERSGSLSLSKNLYKVNINLYYINNDDHTTKALIVLKKLEEYAPKSIVSMESSRMIINADEFSVSKYSLTFENWRTNDH